MSSPSLEEFGVLREWTPMSRLLQNIPLRSRRGLFVDRVRFNCVAADVHCIALGTSTGDIFWYNRSNHVVHQFKAEKPGFSVTCISVVSTVDFMLAAGDKSGVVTIFRIPREVPVDWTSFSSSKYRKEQIERFTVNELHSGPVTALCWSLNGQKLFSGDQSGTVVFTEVDYVLNITKACKILNEKLNIVQLCYNQREQVLLVSSEYRSILCKNEGSQWKITQVGQRDRLSLQELGACFHVDDQNELTVFSSRAGLRLWKADSQGNVKFTIQFKKLVEQSKNHVKLLRPPIRNVEGPVEFGRVYYWRDGLFVSQSSHNVIVFDPMAVSVVAVLLRVNDVIASLSVTERELFIVYGDRELVRLSYSPDAYDSSLGGIGSIASGEPVSSIPEFSLNPIEGSPIVTPSPGSDTMRIKLSATTANTEPHANEVNYGTDSTVLLPPIVALTEGVCELRVDCSRQYEFSSIGQEKFDEIIYSKKIKRKKSKKKYITPSSGAPNPIDPSQEDSTFSQTADISSGSSDLEKSMQSIDAIVEEFCKSEILENSDADDAINASFESKDFNPIVESTVETYGSRDFCVVSNEVTPLRRSSSPLQEKNTVQPAFETSAPLLPRPVSVHGMVDGWNELSVPGKISWLVTCGDQVVICTNHCHVYVTNDTVWERLPFKACFISISPCGRHAVRIYCSVAYYSNDWRSNEWESLFSNVDWAMAVENKIWLVSLGDIYYKSYLSDTIIKLPCNYSAQKLFTSDHGLLAVTTDGELVIFDSIEWSSLNVSHYKIKFLAFGTNRLFWMVDSDNRLFLTEKLDRENWWEAILPVCDYREFVSLSISKNIVYTVFSVPSVNSIIAYNKVSALGVRWEPWGMFSGAVMISCEGVFEERGSIWILCEGNKLFCCSLDRIEALAIDTPCKIVCMASTSLAFWVLSDGGEIYSRLKLSYECPTGTDWTKLNMDQLSDEVRLIHITCSCDVVWGCDSRGRVYMLAGSPHEVTTQMFASAWIEVGGSSLPESVRLAKVYVGPESHMVWALDATGNVYVREAVYPYFITGADWVQVRGNSAHHLALSTESVWALSSDAIYRRSGISESNFIGDSWVRIGPPSLRDKLLFMSISINDKVWLLQNDFIYKLEEKLFPISDDAVVEKDWSLL